MSATVRTVTQYPHSDPAVITSPLNTPVAFDTLLANSTAIGAMQAQIADLVARVTALENAAS